MQQRITNTALANPKCAMSAAVLTVVELRRRTELPGLTKHVRY